MSTTLIWVAAYLIGSIPCGVLIARAQNIDIREHGSGNVGATNVARILGKKLGIFTLLGDCLKGIVPVGVAIRFLENPVEIALTGFIAFCGHLFPVFLKFKGGKGVATGLGVFLCLMPAAALCSVAVFSITLGITGYVSAGSILAAVSLPLLGTVFHMPHPYIYTAIAAATLITLKHRQNIQRLISGTESKFRKK